MLNFKIRTGFKENVSLDFKSYLKECVRERVIQIPGRGRRTDCEV